MVRRSLSAFFNPRPSHSLPIPNGSFVALQRPSAGTLAAPAELASTGEVPKCEAATTFSSEFHYWVPLDKHTPQGKEALRRLGAALGVSYRQRIWAGFYFESGRMASLFDQQMPESSNISLS